MGRDVTASGETVIPNYFDERISHTQTRKRITSCSWSGMKAKGPYACATAKAAGMKLVIAGQMNERKPFEILSEEVTCGTR